MLMKRLRAMIRAKGPSYRNVLLRQGKYKNMNYTGLDDEADVELDDSEFEAEEDRSVRRLAKTLKVQAKVETDSGKGSSAPGEEQKKRQKVLQRLYNYVSEKMYHVTLSLVGDDPVRRISNKGVVEGDGPMAYKALMESYHATSVTAIMSLYRRLFLFKMQGAFSTLDAYTHEHRELVNSLTDRGQVLPRLLVVCNYLEGLTEKCEGIRVTLYDAEEDLTLQKVCDRVKSFQTHKGYEAGELQNEKAHYANDVRGDKHQQKDKQGGQAGRQAQLF